MSKLERLCRDRSIVPQTFGGISGSTIAPRAVTCNDRAPLASESGRSLTSADASHAIVQSPPSDVGRTDGAGKGLECVMATVGVRVSSPGFRLRLGMALNSTVGKRLLMGWSTPGGSPAVYSLTGYLMLLELVFRSDRVRGEHERVGSSLAAVLGFRALSLPPQLKLNKSFVTSDVLTAQVVEAPSFAGYHSTSSDCVSHDSRRHGYSAQCCVGALAIFCEGRELYSAVSSLA